MLLRLSSLLLSRVLLEERSAVNLIRGAWASIYKVYIAVVTATTLLPKLDAQVHDWASRKHPWEAKLFSRAGYSSYDGANCHLFCLKCLYSMIVECRKISCDKSQSHRMSYHSHGHKS